MTSYKVRSLRSLREEMKAVARGDRPAPAGAARPSFNSVEAVVRLLTPDRTGSSTESCRKRSVSCRRWKAAFTVLLRAGCGLVDQETASF